MRIHILTREDLNPGLAERIYELYAELSPNRIPQKLEDMFAEDNRFIMAYVMEEDEVLGIASMATYRIVSGYKGWIEDVVVKSSARGRGIGRALIKRLLAEGRDMGLTAAYLYTEDHRIPAIKLYKSLGFSEKESRIYQLRY